MGPDLEMSCVTITICVKESPVSPFSSSFATDCYGCHSLLVFKTQQVFVSIFLKPPLVLEIVALIHSTISMLLPEILNLHIVSICL